MFNFKKINKIDLFTKRIYNIWNNHFEKKKYRKKINNILVSFDITFSEKEELKKWLKIFFTLQHVMKKILLIRPKTSEQL